MIRLKFILSLKLQEKVILHDFTKIVETRHIHKVRQLYGETRQIQDAMIQKTFLILFASNYYVLN